MLLKTIKMLAKFIRRIIHPRRTIRNCLSGIQKKEWAKPDPKLDFESNFSTLFKKISEQNKIYLYMHHYFFNKIPEIIKIHKKFFIENNKGCCEEAMHAMWWLLFKEFRPKSCIEIGVHRGQIISLWALIAKNMNYSCKVYGISPFTGIGDSVSNYEKNIDYYQDTLNNFEHFKLKKPTLVKGLSTDENSKRLINSKKWDLIYIDGSHDYETVLKDYEICLKNLKKNGFLVFDDAALYTPYEPPLFAFKGHPGPSKVAINRAKKEMKFVGGVGHNLIFRKI